LTRIEEELSDSESALKSVAPSVSSQVFTQQVHPLLNKTHSQLWYAMHPNGIREGTGAGMSQAVAMKKQQALPSLDHTAGANQPISALYTIRQLFNKWAEAIVKVFISLFVMVFWCECVMGLCI
jgi:hypothetical protein